MNSTQSGLNGFIVIGYFVECHATAEQVVNQVIVTMVFNESLHKWIVDSSLLNVCLLDVSSIAFDNNSLKFLGVCDFALKFAWIVCLNQTEVSIFLSDFVTDSDDHRNFEMVMEIEGVWMGRLESRFWGVCCMGFENTFVVLVEFLGVI